MRERFFTHFLRFTALAVGIVLVFGARASAQALLPPTPVSGVAAAAADIIEITRVRLTADQQAIRVDTLDRHEIERTMLIAPGNAMRALGELPGARVQITSPELGLADLRVNGLRGQYTRLLADGVPTYFDLPGGIALPQISPIDLGRVELVANGASALFGANAINVIDLIARQPVTREREILFSQSSERGTDAAFSAVLPPTGHWSSTWMFSGHRQEQRDIDGDGWSDIPGYRRAVVHPRVFWNNGNGKSAFGTANVIFEKREGGSAFALQKLETKSADGMLGGQMPFHGAILQGSASLYAQSRIRKFSDGTQHERRESATIEMELRGTSGPHTWIAGLSEDWFTIRSHDKLWTTYTAPQTGIFVHDDVHVKPWLFVSGSARVGHRVTYPITFSPRGSVRVRNKGWTAGFSADQSFFEPTATTEETEAAGALRLTVDIPKLDAEHIRNVSGDFGYETNAATVKITAFQSHIDHPVLVDRGTFSLYTSDKPVLTHGVELLGRVRQGAFSASGTYTYLMVTEEGGRDVALTPRHSVDLIAMMDDEHRGRVGVQISYTGVQRLDGNPYRTASEPYTIVTLFGERWIGRWALFVNADNLSNVRQTHWDPIALPARNEIDGRWTVDQWAPVAGRVINGGIRARF